MLKRKYKNLIKILKYYNNHKSLIRVLVIVMLFASSLGMALPYFYSKRLIGITDTILENVLLYSLIIITIIFFHHIFWYLWERLGSVLTNRVSNDIKEQLIDNMINTKYEIIKHHTSGYYLERLNDDVYEVSSFLSNVLGTIVDSLTNISFLVLIYVLNYQCGLIFTIGIIILYLIDYLRIKKDLKYTEQLKELNEIFNSKINENYRGIKDIKGLGINKEIITKTIEITNTIKNTQIKKDNICALLSRIKTFLQYIIEAILIVYSVGILIPSGDLTIVILLMIIDYSGFMYDLVGFMAKMKDYFVKGDYKAKRLLEILDNNDLDKYGKVKKINNHDIKINSLSFRYRDSNNTVLDNISLNIKENTTSIFIGSSGSGKSTLFGILTKLLTVPNKKVFIGNADINSLSNKTIKDYICIINQEPFILNDTILNNIKIVKPNATFKEIENATKIANIYDEIMSFNQNFDTLVVENGNNLSGGQKQRIALARAILKNSPILLFDEPTSALDKYNQELFYNTLKELKRNKTIFIISHKYDYLDMFDNVFEINNGTIMSKK